MIIHNCKTLKGELTLLERACSQATTVEVDHKKNERACSKRVFEKSLVTAVMSKAEALQLLESGGVIVKNSKD